MQLKRSKSVNTQRGAGEWNNKQNMKYDKFLLPAARRLLRVNQARVVVPRSAGAVEPEHSGVNQPRFMHQFLDVASRCVIYGRRSYVRS